MSVWVGGSVGNVKQPQAVLPTKNLTLTLLPASPRPISRPFCDDVQTSCGAVCHRERVTYKHLVALKGLKDILILAGFIYIIT